jgi:hypothetical protein
MDQQAAPQANTLNPANNFLSMFFVPMSRLKQAAGVLLAWDRQLGAKTTAVLRAKQN